MRSLTLPEVARELGVNYSKVRRLVNSLPEPMDRFGPYKLIPDSLLPTLREMAANRPSRHKTATQKRDRKAVAVRRLMSSIDRAIRAAKEVERAREQLQRIAGEE